MNKSTGFRAYAVYLFLKNVHFKDNNYSIMNITNIPMKDKLLDNWNKKRRLQDGIKFREIEKECSEIKQLALLYASYYVEDSNFYIQDIFEDDFQKYKDNITILNNLKEYVINDFQEIINHCKHYQIPPKDMFVSKTEIPRFFKMGSSFNSLVIFNDVFNLIELNKNIKINSLEKVRWDTIKLNIKFYKPLIQCYLNKENWKEILKKNLDR